MVIAPLCAEVSVFKNQHTGKMQVDGVETEADGIRNLGLQLDIFLSKNVIHR